MAREKKDPREEIDPNDGTRIVAVHDGIGGRINIKRSALRALGEGWREVEEVPSPLAAPAVGESVPDTTSGKE